MSGKQVQSKEVSIDCPVCYSGNQFVLTLANEDLTCNDCGFLLVDSAALKALDSGRCVVCGNDRFYFDSFLNLGIFGRSMRCYVCEASYKGVKMNEPDAKFIDEVAEQLTDSDAATKLEERAAHWH